MQELVFKQHASKVNFRKNDNIWNINLIYETENECIKREMEEVVGTKVNLKGLQATLDFWPNFESDIREHYAGELKCKSTIWEKAVKGVLETECPSKKSINTMRVSFWIALLAEISVLLIQQAFAGDFNPFIVILAVILGLGGFLQGWGIGHLLFRHWKDNTGRSDGESSFQHWLFVGIGTVLILLISVARGSGSFDSTQFFLIFFITLFFGEAVAICEALSVKLSEQRDQCIQDMQQAQLKQASQTHFKNLQNGTYEKDYKTLANDSYETQIQMNPHPTSNSTT